MISLSLRCLFFLAASPTITLGIASVHLTDGRNKLKQPPSCQYITSTDGCKEQSTIFHDKDYVQFQTS